MEAPNYHPMPGPIAKLQNKKWHSIAYLGESKLKNIGEEFVIHLVSCTSVVSKEFSSYIEQTDKSKDWTGIKNYPDNIKFHHSIRVIRK